MYTEIEFKKNNEENDVISISAESSLFSFVITIDGEKTNFISCKDQNDVDWITIKKRVRVENDITYNEYEVYVKDNLSVEERSTILELQNIFSEELDYNFLRINQSACNYKIEVSEVKDDEKDEDNIKSFNLEEISKYKKFDLKEINEYKTFKLTVYGNSKVPKLSSSFIEILKPIEKSSSNENDSLVTEENDITYEAIDYDNSLYYKLSKLEGNAFDEYNSYKLKIKQLGNYSSLKEYYYHIPIVHSDNQNCVLDLLLNPKDNENIKDEKFLEGIISKEVESLGTTFSQEKMKQNEKNKGTLLSKEDSVILDNKMYSHKVIVEKPELEPISNVEINDNIISLQTNVYDSNDNIVNDSMILVYSKAIWCNTTNEFKDNKHYVTIICDNNFWGSERKTIILIRNAEDMSSKVTFLVTQSKDGKITIKLNPNQ